MKDLEGKKIVVCGGSGRMGGSICSYLETIGAIPIIIDNQIEDISRYLSLKCDLSNANETRRVFEQLFSEHPQVDHFVNAIRIRSEELEESDIIASSDAIMLEMNAYLYPMHFFCMKERVSGSLVNVSSILSERIDLEVPLAYHVAKAAIEQASRYYTAKYKDYKVRINCILPGLISNGAAEYSSVDPDASHYSNLANKLPLMRSGSHDEVAALVAFLLSDASGFVVGANVKIDGGGDLVELLSV